MPLRILRWLWCWPLPPTNNVITQTWNFPSSRGHHAGVDIACAVGTPIYAARRGKVIATDPVGTGAAGQWILVQVFGLQRWYCYEHLSSIWVKPGDSVNKGQQIGKTGMTGDTTGPHLHFGVTSETDLGSYADTSHTFDPLLFLTVPK